MVTLRVVGLAIALLVAPPVAAFECPVAERPRPGVLGESREDMQRLSRLLAQGDIESRVAGIVTDLRRSYPAIPRYELVNYLVGAYCPVVRAKPDLSDGQKDAEISEFGEWVFDLLTDRQP